jgi:AbrB family looped-hinge helix DNA binding protein
MNAIMNAIAEIDKSGRLVVPKKLRDALHLVPGTRLTVRQQGSGILLEPEAQPRGLYMKDGWLVYDTGPLPPEHVNWVDEAREARADELMEPWTSE